MKTSVSKEQVATYADTGYLVVEEFLDAVELEQWRVAVDEAVAERGNRALSFETEGDAGAAGEPSAGDDPDVSAEEDSAQVFTQRLNLWQTNESVRRLMLDPALGQVMAAVAGIAGVRIWHDQALIKEPFASPTAFHLDVPYWSFSSPDAISIWVALDDATLENGCLYYIPGSHKANRFDNVSLGMSIGAVFKYYPEWRDVQAVPCPVPAGGALLHNGLTIHGAGANMTPARRRAMTCAYMPDGCTFNGTPNVLPPWYLQTLQVGDVLDNEAQNPLIYPTPPVARRRQR